MERELDNCSQCGDYGCEKLKQHLVVCEELQSKIGAEILEEDRKRFVRPYENKRRLDALSD